MADQPQTAGNTAKQPTANALQERIENATQRLKGARSDIAQHANSLVGNDTPASPPAQLPATTPSHLMQAVSWLEDEIDLLRSHIARLI
jgi:hypothetical protein